VRTLASMRYERSVLECALDLARVGGFTAREFSEKCNYKLNQNLYRRLNQFVEQGHFQQVQSYTGTGHMATFYILPVRETTGGVLDSFPF